MTKETWEKEFDDNFVVETIDGKKLIADFHNREAITSDLIKSFIRSLLANPETHKNCISREKVEKAIEKAYQHWNDRDVFSVLRVGALEALSDLRKELLEDNQEEDTGTFADHLEEIKRD